MLNHTHAVGGGKSYYMIIFLWASNFGTPPISVVNLDAPFWLTIVLVKLITLDQVFSLVICAFRGCNENSSLFALGTSHQW
jgi:hypothetical protein